MACYVIKWLGTSWKPPPCFSARSIVTTIVYSHSIVYTAAARMLNLWKGCKDVHSKGGGPGAASRWQLQELRTYVASARDALQNALGLIIIMNQNGTISQWTINNQACFSFLFMGLGKASVLSISSDGKRLGQPAEETTIFAAWAGNSNLACWLPPMAICLHWRLGACAT